MNSLSTTPELLRSDSSLWGPEQPLSEQTILELVRVTEGVPLKALKREALAPDLTLYSKKSWSELQEGRPISLSIGAFDGVHLGHLNLLAACAEQAQRSGCVSVALTFNPDPSALVPTQHDSAMLMTPSERVSALAASGVEAVCVVSFTPELLHQSYSDFVLTTLAPLGTLSAIHVGEGFRLGAGGKGTVEALTDLGRSHGFSVFAHKLESQSGLPISASRIRALIGEGEVLKAARLMGRLPRVGGVVVHGRGEGTSLGFPTANLEIPADAALPKMGVYAGLFRTGNRVWPAAIHTGVPPMFESATANPVEAHVLGFEGSLYGCEAEVYFLKLLRTSRRFDSLAELKTAVLGDISWVKHSLGERGVEGAL